MSTQLCDFGHLAHKPPAQAAKHLAARWLVCTTLLGFAAAGLGACRSTGGDGPVEPGTTTTGSATGSSTGATTTAGTTTGTTGGDGGGQAASGYRFIGRVPADSNTLSWSGSAVELSFTGTQGDLQFTTLDGNNYIGLSIDGGNITRTFVQASASIAFGPLAQANHVIRATKLNEGRLGEVVFNGFSTDGQALLGNTTSRRIEFIGDSITAAYGIDGNAPCTNTAALEDATQSFATLAAAALSADASLIAVAGKGMVRNDTSDTSTTPVLMPNYWTRYIANNANSVYSYPAEAAPQVVVITLGTNDYEYTDGTVANTALRAPLDSSSFVSGYVSFIQAVQTRYPQAKFVLCSSPMLSDTYPTSSDQQHTSLLTNLNTIASSFSNSTVAVLDFPALTTAQATGCGGHPNIDAHHVMASLLQAKIQQLMNW
ncbi:hypothetical protein Q3G72_032819 [Acer saccharum]|nr:hypothetical protein Q3G72_032819 [Acer saccharum]